MRERECSLINIEGTFRIVGLGDSVMFGWGVREEDLYLKALEQKLNEHTAEFHAQGQGRRRRFETLNFAVPGYNTAMEVATFEHKASAFRPDLVLVHFVNNDLDVPFFMTLSKKPFSLHTSFLWDFISSRWKQLSSTHSETEGEFMDGSLQEMSKTKETDVDEQYRYMVGERGFRQAMAKLGALTKTSRIPVIILYGKANSETEKLLRQVSKEWDFYLLPIKPYVDSFVESHHIPNTPQARQDILWISKTDPHPNALGHSIYAEGLFNFWKQHFPFENQAKNQ